MSREPPYEAGRGCGVGRGLGVGVKLGVAEGVGVGVGFDPACSSNEPTSIRPLRTR